MSCACQECGKQYKVDLLISDELWEKIKPIGKTKGAGLLCGSCIMKKIEEFNSYDVCFLTKKNKILVVLYEWFIKQIKRIKNRKIFGTSASVEHPVNPSMDNPFTQGDPEQIDKIKELIKKLSDCNKNFSDMELCCKEREKEIVTEYESRMDEIREAVKELKEIYKEGIWDYKK